MANETTPRAAAARMIEAVMADGALLSDLLAKPELGLDAAGRARAQRLATVTLRASGQADRVLGRFLKNLPYVPIMTILRLGTVEMLSERAAAHGVVNDMVALARTRKDTSRGAGLINAVLRKVSEVTPEDWAALPPGRLPSPLRKKLVAAYGGKAVEAMERAHAQTPPLDLTPRRDLDALSALDGEALPTGSLRLRDVRRVTELEGFAEGTWWVQDAAAALPAKILAAQKGETVADLCAAPGGKTLQLAASGAAVMAVDISDARMERVRENLTRTGLLAETLVTDAMRWSPDIAFDAVLLDAPCTATGTIRRHPDLPFAKADWARGDLLALQAGLLDRALTLLRPGGRLVYCTCSLLPEEGEAQIEAALQRHKGLRMMPDALIVPGVELGWIGAHGLRLRPDYWPERGGMDGFFIAVLRKPT